MITVMIIGMIILPFSVPAGRFDWSVRAYVLFTIAGTSVVWAYFVDKGPESGVLAMMWILLGWVTGRASRIRWPIGRGK